MTMAQTQYPPNLTPDQLHFLLTSFADWSLAHGLAVRPQPSLIPENPGNAIAVHAPVALFPSPFPRKLFKEAREIQTVYNELYAKIASEQGEEWLGGIIEEIASVDDFIAQLWKVYKEVKAEGFVQHLSLGLFRSDYMIHKNPKGSNAELAVHQVEFNTISSSFGGLATRVSQLHKHLLRIGAYPDSPIITPSSLPDNPAMTDLADGLAEAHKAYGPGVVSKTTAILFLVQGDERNAFDQRLLEYSLLERHDITTHRITFFEVPHLTTLDPTTKALLYRPPHLPVSSDPIEISTVYFRAGYGPGDYTTPTDWSSRAHLERSRAIKCPTILTQLAGSKKIQQVLAQPISPSSSATNDNNPADILNNFAPKVSIPRLKSTFAPIYPLDSTRLGQHARSLALNPTTAENYVLKPQREGGGNNIYGSKITEFLRSIPETHWSGYILMEKIVPPGGTENLMVRAGAGLKRGEVIGELGVYGVCLWDLKGGITVNREAGWLLRTKGKESEEGGVAAGFGYVDGVVLV
ncbi:hypothetical protein BDZ91DRAFT_710779, partial [Kalaharituber pfeilii]